MRADPPPEWSAPSIEDRQDDEDGPHKKHWWCWWRRNDDDDDDDDDRDVDAYDVVDTKAHKFIESSYLWQTCGILSWCEYDDNDDDDDVKST